MAAALRPLPAAPTQGLVGCAGGSQPKRWPCHSARLRSHCPPWGYCAVSTSILYAWDNCQKLPCISPVPNIFLPLQKLFKLPSGWSKPLESVSPQRNVFPSSLPEALLPWPDTCFLLGLLLGWLRIMNDRFSTSLHGSVSRHQVSGN